MSQTGPMGVAGGSEAARGGGGGGEAAVATRNAATVTFYQPETYIGLVPRDPLSIMFVITMMFIITGWLICYCSSFTALR